MYRLTHKHSVETHSRKEQPRLMQRAITKRGIKYMLLSPKYTKRQNRNKSSIECHRMRYFMTLDGFLCGVINPSICHHKQNKRIVRHTSVS